MKKILRSFREQINTKNGIEKNVGIVEINTFKNIEFQEGNCICKKPANLLQRILKEQKNIVKNIQKNIVNGVWSIIIDCVMRLSWLMADINALVVAKLNRFFSRLTILIMMVVNGERPIKTIVEQRFLDGLNEIIGLKATKFFVLTVIKANTAIKAFALIKSRRCNDYPLTGVASSEAKRTAFSKENEDIVLSAWRHAAVSFLRNDCRIASCNENNCFNYGNELGVAAGLIFGIKKSVFNSADFGTIVISSYSPDPA